MAVHEKCLVDSTSRKNEQNGLMQFFKIMFKSVFVKVTQA